MALCHQSMARRMQIAARGVDVFYSGKQALFEIDLDIGSRAVTALIGRRVAASQHFFGV